MRRVSPGILVLVTLVACGRTPEPGGEKPAPPPAPRPASAPAPEAAAPRADPGRDEQPKVIPVDAPRTREDLQRFCTITRAVKADAQVPRSERAKVVVERLLASPVSSDFLMTLNDLGDKPPREQYAALRKLAASNGAPDWTCPELAEELLPPWCRCGAP